MIDIVDRLRFDATRCEAQFSKGIASNIEEAAKVIEGLRVALQHASAHLSDLEYHWHGDSEAMWKPIRDARALGQG